jgi:transcriptional regulator with XRE-family HTH domain
LRERRNIALLAQLCQARCILAQPPITPLQARLARAALGLSLRDLGGATGLAPNTITRFELGRGGVHAANLARLRDVFEQRGVVFLPTDEVGEATVRLRHSSAT